MSAIAARRARLIAAQTSSSPSGSSSADASDEVRPGQAQSTADKGPNAKHSHAAPTLTPYTVDATQGHQRYKRRRAVQEEVNDAVGVNSSCPTSDDEDAVDRGARRATDTAHAHQSDEVMRTAVVEQSFFAPITRGDNRNVVHIEATASQSKGKGKADCERASACALRTGERLCLVGVGSIEVLAGAITIGGATLTSKHREAIIFAPTAGPQPVAHAIGVVADSDATDKYDFGRPWNAYAAIVHLTIDSTSHVERISRIYPSMARQPFATSTLAAFDWPRTGLAPAEPKTRDFLPASMPQSWSQALHTLSLAVDVARADRAAPPVCLVRGPKRVGKSTLCRYALQRLLTSGEGPVAYLETDLGQSEFGLPGMVSLHVFNSAVRVGVPSSPLVFGPSWASIRHPVKSHFLSDVSPKGNPSAYLAAIADLFSDYNQRWRQDDVPLIVNTQGWMKGLGANLLSQIEDLIKSTYIFDVIEEMTPETGANATLLFSPSHRQAAARQDRPVHVIQVEAAPVAVTRERGVNAVEARTMNILSYFYSVRLPGLSASGQTSTSNDWPQWSLDATLVDLPPYVIDLNAGGLKGGIHVQAHVAAVPERLKLSVLNGSCVGMVVHLSDGAEVGNNVTGQDGERLDRTWTEAFQKPLPGLPSSTCVGLAIVRSIDVHAGKLHLLTPLTSDALRSAIRNLQAPGSGPNDDQPTVQMSLVKGALDVPVWLSLDFPTLDAVRAGPLLSSSADPAHLAGVALANVPYIDFDLDAVEATVGMAKRRVRRNLLRPSQRTA